MTDEAYAAVLDRFEEERAVLLLEADGELADELVVPRELLPPDGRHQDAVFGIRVRSDRRTEIRYDPEETAARRENAQRRFDRLARRLPDEDERPPEERDGE